MRLASGTRLGPYEILAPLGAGGMGEVYKAHDVRLDRAVALKTLPAAAARDTDAADRFDREARLIASLSHPHICPIFDVGRHEGTPFLVMEYLEGETLAERLRTGPLPLGDALRFASQIAAALAAAHARNIAHRDLKPANIQLTADGARVLDFGLAKFVLGDRPAAQAETRAGFATAAHTIVGTAAYMSPEQSRGDEVDFRTDCWSFGVVLYEMLTGRPLFTGPDPISVIAAVLTQPVDRAVADLPPDVPQGVRTLLSRLLERNRERRLGDLRDMATLVTSGGSAPAPAGPPRAPGVDSPGGAAASIVVLPFANQSPDPDNEYFSDGLTEEVIADLSKVGALRVISRTTAMRMKHTDLDLAGIAARLNVRYALEGSVRKVGTQLRITAQLVDTATDATLWSDKFSGTLDEVFDIQERVSRAIVKALSLTLTEREDRRLQAPSGPSGFVFDTYLRARRDIWSFMPERLERAEAELKRALAAAGDHVLLYAGLGLLHWQYVNGGLSADRRHLDEASRCARRVLELDPASAAGPQLLGLIAAQSGEQVEWVRHLTRAVELEPHDPYSVVWLAFGWTWAGFPDRSRPLYERLLATDPLFDYLLFGLAFEAYFAGDYALAEHYFERARQLSPDHPGLAMTLVQTYASAGRIDRMAEWLAASAPDPLAHPLHTVGHILAYAVTGNADAADELVSSDLEAKLWSDFQYPHAMAQAMALLGRADEALRWLGRSVERGFLHHEFLARDPLLANLRGHAGFAAVLAQARLAAGELKARVDAPSASPNLSASEP
jgi:serine/threonine protein kinase